MNPLTLYFVLSDEFKRNLDRELTNEEDGFIKWIVEQDINKKKHQKEWLLSS